MSEAEGGRNSKALKRPAGLPDGDLLREITAHTASSLRLSGFEITDEEVRAMLKLSSTFGPTGEP